MLVTLVLFSIAQAVPSMQRHESTATHVAAPITAGLERPAPRAGPFARLFIPSEEREAGTLLQRHALEQRQETEETPKIVCGMVVMPADPRIDPRMIHRSEDRSTTFHIKRIAPPTCAE
jgi:hypothetical protein